MSDKPAPAPAGGAARLPPPPVDGEGRARFLIVCLGGIGRAVNALPVLHALRVARPDSEIGWAVEGAVSPLLDGHPELTRLHVLPGVLGQKRHEEWGMLSWWKRRRAAREFEGGLKSFGYTAAIDLQGDKRSARISRATGAAARVGYAPPEGRACRRGYYTARIIPSPRLRHVAERNLSLLVPLAVRRAPPVFVFPDFAGARERLAQKIEPHAGGYAVVHPGSTWPSRQWPVDSFGELARRIVSDLSLEVLVTASGDVERSRAEAVAGGAPSGVKAAPALGLDELAALVKDAALFVGGDTGPMHLASGMGVPTVAIFGPTLRERRGPRGELSRAVDAGLGCSGCGRRVCPYRTDACMRNVSVGAVFDLARELVGGARSG